LKVKSLRLIFNPLADAYLCLGKDGARKNGYVVGWAPRSRDHFIYSKKFDTRSKALTCFNKFSEHAIPYVDDLEIIDFSDYDQDEAVYAWEAENVYPGLERPINRNTALKIVREVCNRYGIKSLKMNWNITGAPSEYDYEERILNIRQNDLQILLHELAHAITDLYGEYEMYPAHGPIFVKCLIDVYTRWLFAGDPAQKERLTASARKAGLMGPSEQQLKNKKWTFNYNRDQLQELAA
jgi:hypothetical protein